MQYIPYRNKYIYIYLYSVDRKKHPYFNNTLQLVKINVSDHVCLILLQLPFCILHTILFWLFLNGPFIDFTNMHVFFSDGPHWSSLVTLCPWSTVPDIPCNILALCSQRAVPVLSWLFLLYDMESTTLQGILCKLCIQNDFSGGID